MGFDLGSGHAVDKRAVAAIRRHLHALPRNWLQKSASVAAAAIEDDHAKWSR